MAKTSAPMKDIFEDPQFEALASEIAQMSQSEIEQRIRLLDNDVKVMRSEYPFVRAEQHQEAY